MNYLQLVQKIADEMDFEQPSTLSGTLSRQVRRTTEQVNRAYNHVWLKLFPQNDDAETTGTISTVSDTESYSLPSGMKTVDQVTKDDIQIPCLPWNEYNRLKGDTYIITDSGPPVRCAIYQRKIYLYPTPDTASTIDVFGKATYTEMSDDSDTPALHADHHYCILERALYLAMNYEQNPRTAEQRNISNEAIQNVKNQIRNNAAELPPRRISEREMRAAEWTYRIVDGS